MIGWWRPWLESNQQDMQLNSVECSESHTSPLSGSRLTRNVGSSFWNRFRAFENWKRQPTHIAHQFPGHYLHIYSNENSIGRQNMKINSHRELWKIRLSSSNFTSEANLLSVMSQKIKSTEATLGNLYRWRVWTYQSTRKQPRSHKLRTCCPTSFEEGEMARDITGSGTFIDVMVYFTDPSVNVSPEKTNNHPANWHLWTYHSWCTLLSQINCPCMHVLSSQALLPTSAKTRSYPSKHAQTSDGITWSTFDTKHCNNIPRMCLLHILSNQNNPFQSPVDNRSVFLFIAQLISFTARQTFLRPFGRRHEKTRPGKCDWRLQYEQTVPVQTLKRNN